MKKWYILYSLALCCVFIGCNWITDPYIIGIGVVEKNANDKYICKINKKEVVVDSLLINDINERVFVPPYKEGMTVTQFRLGYWDYFFEGEADAKTIKRVFFSKDSNGGDITLKTFISIIAIFFIDTNELSLEPDTISGKI